MKMSVLWFRPNQVAFVDGFLNCRHGRRNVRTNPFGFPGNAQVGVPANLCRDIWGGDGHLFIICQR